MGLALIIPNIDFSGANIGRVTPAEDVPLVSLSVSGPDSVTGGADAATYLPVYNPANTNQRSVAWSVQSGGTYATITTGGVLTILPGASASSVTIRVTSTINPSIYADKTIAVTYGSQELPEGAIPCDLVYTDGYSTFVETGIVPSAAMSYDSDIFWSRPSSGSSCPIGFYISGKRYAPFMFEENKPEIQFDYWYWATANTHPTVVRYREKAILTQTGASLEIYDEDGNLADSGTATYSETDFTPATSLPILGGRKTSATAVNTGEFRGGLGRVKFYDDDHFGNLIADFIPCYYNGEFGFWDAVSEAFFGGNDSTKMGGTGAQWDTMGFGPNTANSTTLVANEYRKDNRDCITTRLYDIPEGCTSIRFNAGVVQTSENYSLLFVDATGTLTEYYSHLSADRVVAVPANSAKMRMSMDKALMDSCYIYDETNGAYIWKGQNVN